MKINKTNAARLLDRAGIKYELIPYRVDEEHLDAIHVAEELGEPIGQVFKTLVLRGDRTGILVCVVPGDGEVDLIGMKKEYPVFIHQTCRDYASIYVSAGIRGLQLKIDPEDLIRFTRAQVVDLEGHA